MGDVKILPGKRTGNTGRIASGIALGGIPAVLVAAFIVKSMSVEVLRWLVVCVVLYAALLMLKSAMVGSRKVAGT